MTATTTSTTTAAQSSLLESINKEGFVIVRSVLNPSQLTSLRAATQATTAYARGGNWPHVRTLPKQFPPWPVSGPNPAAQGIWGVQLLMHPSIPLHETFIKTYFSQAIISLTKELLQCKDEELVMELFNLLIRPDRDFDLCWHRDDIPPTATAEEEIKRLKEPAWHAQWNLALYDDSSLIVIPESHNRARTEFERTMDPHESNVPGQLIVKMNAGDVVFYNNNILHRGVYDSSVERMTLHGSVGHIKGGSLRANNVLQHGVKDWIEKIDFDNLDGEEKARALKMRENLVRLAEEHVDIKYSLEG